MATATEHGANYILAQDPDSDRFAAAERGYISTKVLSFSVDGLTRSPPVLIESGYNLQATN